jgi:hypothetical protein
MKNQYFGDINDYNKYGLIRSLTQNGAMSSTVCWMLTPGDGGKDGSKREYLNNPQKYMHYDEKLFKTLVKLSEYHGWPSTDLLEDSGVMINTRYFSEIVPELSPERRRYFKRLSNFAEGSELVFFDPDNGIEKPSLNPIHKEATKYLLWREAEQIYQKGHSLLIYQHFTRENRDLFISKMTKKCCEKIGAKQAFSFCTSHVVFFLIPQPAHLKFFENQIQLISGKWGKQILCK